MLNNSLQLLDQIIEMAQAQEKFLKEANLKLNKATRTLGESSLVYHLKILRTLIQEEDKVPSQIKLGEKNFAVCLASHSFNPESPEC